ncbi:HesA/MoeB/ThiF family protein [Sedimentibacter saalensis]|uniref:HesA/MoeB/ThiF family protein n=1 Tax=Sedimentibacter saalensis TaxID=130788 RepID=UPI0028A020D3|nr:HesA/MoeB/ThiF family protein [Sedimentibacter saalensis]
MKGILTPRYERNYKTISVEDQKKLADSTVAIVGCGGLGGTMAEEFARLGIGRLILVDGDTIDETNLNRQLFSTEYNIGSKKVEAARQRLHAVNSSVELTLIDDWFNQDNAADIFSGANLVCDALDSIQRRIDLEESCQRLNKPLVYAGIAGWFGMLGVSLPGDYSVLKVFKDGKENDRGMEKTWGNPAFTPWVMSSLAVAESVKIIVGREPALRNSWLQADLLYMEFETFKIS